MGRTKDQVKKIICVTPTKNEEWIINDFVNSTYEWADQLIVSDQLSTDDTVKIIKRNEKAILINNKSKRFNEPQRQAQLIGAARKIGKDNIIIALDADEFILDFPTKERKKISKLPRGTVIYFKWLNIHPDLSHYWMSPNRMPFGYVDDGARHRGRSIHSPRVPLRKDHKKYYSNIKIFHLQYVNWERMKYKQRWYQAWEWINLRNQSPIYLYRKYHHMDYVESDLKNIPPKYRKLLEKKVNLDKLTKFKKFWWKREIIEMIKENNRKLQWVYIWDVKWKNGNRVIEDPRSILVKFVHKYLALTQKHYGFFVIKVFDYFLSFLLKPIYTK